MFLLPERKIISGYGVWRFNLSKGWWRHYAIDYAAYYVPLRMPFDGQITTRWEPEGGRWIHFENHEVVIKTAHNSKIYKTGFAYEGEIIGKTGNTGYITSGAHSHVEIISKLTGQKFNPENYHWGSPLIKSNYMQLVRQYEQGKEFYQEVSVLDISGTRHAFPNESSMKAYTGINDSNKVIAITDVPHHQYIKYPRGRDFPTV